MSRSVFVGDHVWIGQEAFISKGTRIGSGSIIGAKSVTGGKSLPSNCSLAGVPCKIIKKNIFWLKPSVHSYTADETKKSMRYNKDKYLYHKDDKQIDFDKLDKAISSSKTSEDMLNCLKEMIFENEDKNRFFIPAEEIKTSLFSKITGKK